MARRNRRKEQGTRSGTNTDVAPAPAASNGGSVASGSPVARTATIESVRDVFPRLERSYTSEFGYTFHDYQMLSPNDSRPLAYERVVALNLDGYLGSLPGDVDLNRIDDFWDKLFEEVLLKAVTRDGYRHLPDNQTSGVNVGKAMMGLWIATVINVRTLKSKMDSVSWNNATMNQRTSFSGLNRRITEQMGYLNAIQIPSFAQLLAGSFDVVAQYDGGPYVATWCKMNDWMSQFGTIADPIDICEDVMSIPVTRDDFVSLLNKVDMALAILNNRTVIPGFTWVSDGRGADQDLKYWRILLHELVYPTGFKAPEQIKTDLAMFTHILYGDAIYGSDIHKELDIEVSRKMVAYPFIPWDDANQSSLIYRRGFVPDNPLFQAGFLQTWGAIKESDENGSNWVCLLGLFHQIGDSSETSAPNVQAYRVGTMYSAPLAIVADPSFNMDDADEIRGFLESYSPLVDHQWLDGLFLNQDDHEVVTPASIAITGYHEPIGVPFEALRAALCATFNVPFVR